MIWGWKGTKTKTERERETNYDESSAPKLVST
jgi:hypothetical protein